MPIVTDVFTHGTPTHEHPVFPAGILADLQRELAAVGMPVDKTESGPNPVFGPATQRQLMRFQERHGLAANGDLDPTTGGILTLSALVETEGDAAKLRGALNDALGSVPGSPGYGYWLGRYAVMAGDYATAATALAGATGFPGMTVEIGPIIDPGPQPRQPEVPHPENFYSYREDLIDQPLLDELRSGLESLTVADYAAHISSPGNPVDPSTVDLSTFTAFVSRARSALSALAAWQTGNHHAADRELALATKSYAQAQAAVADYLDAGAGTATPAGQRIRTVLAQRMQDEATYSPFWTVLRWRRVLLSLVELEEADRDKTVGSDGAFSSAAAFVALLIARDEFGTNQAALNQLQRLDTLLVVLATVWIPLALAEYNSQLRQFDAAIAILSDLLAVQGGVDTSFRYLCEFIEIPFVRLLMLQALLDRADAEFKAGATVDAQTFPDAPIYHGRLAAQTYEAVLARVAQDGQYVTHIAQGRDDLVASIDLALQNKDTTSVSFRSLGNALTVSTITAVTGVPAGLDSTLGPHQPIATIAPLDGRTSNPRVYAIGLLATAKLEQIKAGLNYLGYAPDYVPPWRFALLLERARYFSEHAKNAQRDYLNFLGNAEHEEFQELSLTQNVELEKSNLRIETASVDQAGAGVATAQSAAAAATLHGQNARQAVIDYADFAFQADEADAWSTLGSIFNDVVDIGKSVVTENPAGVIGGLLALNATVDQSWVSHVHRELEQSNLERSASDADAATAEALKRLDEARASLVVAGLRRQAAVLRHGCAVENLNYARNRTLNADQWFRLANLIRGVSDVYLQSAIELAFLAQQAHAFESDRPVDVIRFDYDVSSVGSMLAADFLLADLDSLEQDLLVSQQARQQQVRYVVSMARDFPEALGTLADTGEVTFSVRLEELERRFPGLINLRVSSVDLLPVALMDPTRLSVELTHLGTGMIRVKAQPGTSPLNTSDLAAGADWLPHDAGDWPVKIHVTGPDTSVISGLPRQDAGSLGVSSANERGAFEGLPGASAWRIEMSMSDNQVVPGTLADVLVTFALSGYYESEFKDVVMTAVASPRPSATTSFISARRALPDAYYSLVHSGRVDWATSERMLATAGSPRELRNVAVQLAVVPDGPELGRCYCRYPVEIQVAAGAIRVLTALPQFELTPNGLTLSCAFGGPAGTDVTWDFGDGASAAQGATVEHVYARPGRFQVLTRLVTDGRLFEYRSAVVVSANHPVLPPLVVSPTLTAGAVAADGTVAVTVTPPQGVTDVSIECSAASARGWAAAGPAILNLAPGSYRLAFSATRKLSARFYGKQRYLPDEPVDLFRGRVATNRTFDLTTRAETTAAPNTFTTQLFGAQTLSPVDRWTLELPLEENPWFVTVSGSDVTEFDGSELVDAVLGLEFSSPE